MKENDKNKRQLEMEIKRMDNNIAAWIDFQKGNEKKITETKAEIKAQEDRIYTEFKTQMDTIT